MGLSKGEAKQLNAFNCLAFMVLEPEKPAKDEYLWDNSCPFIQPAQ
jgi:hypothetical protein